MSNSGFLKIFYWELQWSKRWRNILWHEKYAIWICDDLIQHSLKVTTLGYKAWYIFEPFIAGTNFQTCIVIRQQYILNNGAFIGAFYKGLLIELVLTKFFLFYKICRYYRWSELLLHTSKSIAYAKLCSPQTHKHRYSHTRTQCNTHSQVHTYTYIHTVYNYEFHPHAAYLHACMLCMYYNM